MDMRPTPVPLVPETPPAAGEAPQAMWTDDAAPCAAWAPAARPAAGLPLREPAPVAATGAALVTLGYCAAFAVAAPLTAPDPAFGAAAADGQGTAVVAAVMGGLLLGLPLAAQALHAQLARPQAEACGRDDAPGPRYVYAPGARRRMALGLGAAYATAAVLAAGLVTSTGAWSALRVALAY
ncbi:MAG: hypothetical protein RJA99_349 [Pseudomonadota bacterium]|jgi:hypothetical protein